MFNWLRKKPESRSTTVIRDGDAIRIGVSSDGITVSEETALRLVDVRACVDIISADIASLSMHAYERLSDDEREKLSQHPNAQLLKRPNPFMTRHDWLSSSITRMLLYGQSFDFLDWEGLKISGVYPLGNSKVEIIRPSGNLKYRVTIGDKIRDLEPWQILHFRSFTLDGINGLSPIRHAARTIGSTMQMAKMQEQFFKEGLHLGGVLTHPERLSPEARDKLRDQLNSKHQGVDAAFRWLILQEGMGFEPLGVPFEDAQFVELAKLSTLAISRLFKVPSNRLNVTEGSQSFASAEQANIVYYVSCIRPILDKLESELNYKIWLESERDKFYVEFNPSSLLRGDQASQDASFKAGIDGGWFSRNIVKKKLNLPPIEGGDLHYRPLNMTPIELDTVIPTVGTEEKSVPKVGIDILPLYRDALARVQTKEIKAILRAAKKHSPEEFLNWAECFYEVHRATVAETFSPVMTADSRVEEVDTFAEKHCREHLHQLVETSGDAEAIEALTQSWRQNERREELRNTTLAC